MRYQGLVGSAVLVAAFLVLVPSWAGAEDKPMGVVVLVKEREVVFDQGTDQGVKAGDKVRFYRRVVVHHPVTGATIEDRFAIGESKVDEASTLLSVVRQIKGFTKSPEVGDFAEVVDAAAAKPAKAEAKAKECPVAALAPCPLAVADPEMEALLAAFRDGAGKPIDVRRDRYFQFLLKYPNGKYGDSVGREIAWLNTQQDEAGRLEAARRSGVAAPSPERGVRVYHSEIPAVETGDPVSIVVAVVPPVRVAIARTLVRRAGEKTFEALHMERDGDFYFRARVPAALVKSKGRIEYFVEIVDVDDHVSAIVGTALEPKRIAVSEPVDDSPIRVGRSSATVNFEYVNFDKRGNVDDEYLSFEADFFYRFFTFLYGLRMGVGIFDGKGGELKDIEIDKSNSYDLAVNYGYLELEFEIVKMFHFMVRGLAGNHHHDSEDKGTAVGVMGIEGGVRIGEELKTNLVLAGSFFQDVGYEARIAFTLGIFERWPIMVEGLVTSLPVKESSLGLRLVVGAGYRFTDWLAVMLMGSWNGRTIDHTGPGGGGSVVLSW
ncbi:MAG: hypothetical protein PHU25_14225 [Deltaproteobacteria bacterium]|nr:hypothetical protein [Deltaproteobacteria bacterium]